MCDMLVAVTHTSAWPPRQRAAAILSQLLQPVGLS